MRSNMLGKGVGLPIAIAIVAGGLVTTPAQAQSAQSPLLSIFENVKLSPKFSPDPTRIQGISGGSVAATTIAGRSDTITGPCSGYMDTKPDHTLSLTGFFNYLSLEVESPEDTTLVIQGPGGTWCNDDYQGKNPGIAGQWLAGTYKVWIGSYKPGSYHPYRIKLSEVR